MELRYVYYDSSLVYAVDKTLVLVLKPAICFYMALHDRSGYVKKLIYLLKLRFLSSFYSFSAVPVQLITTGEFNKNPNILAMRIPYSLSIFLSVLVTVSACQGGVHHMYMNNSNGSQTTSHEKEQNHASLIPSQALVSGHPDATTQEVSMHVLPNTVSSDSRGTFVSTEEPATTLSQYHATLDAKPAGGAAQERDDKKEEIFQASSDLEAWFQRFVDAVEHAEEWSEVQGVLSEGKRRGYLDKSVGWDDDQYTPIHYAAEKGKLSIVKELIKREIPADIITDDTQRTPLHLAAQEGHLEVVRFLIEQCNAKWDREDKDGANVLHYAASGT